MIRFDYGANSSNFVLNKRALVPTGVTGKAGFNSIGIHTNIGMSPDALCQQAYVDWIRTVYTSMSAMANRTTEQRYTDADVGHYLQFCQLVDVMLAEAKRDLTMVHFGDLYATNAAADYWGDGYASTISAAVENGPKYWSRWNSVARKMAEMYPHLSVAYYDQFRYLLSTVFQDSQDGRWNFLYYHCFNQSFITEGDTVTVDRALTVAEDLISKFETAVGNTTTGLTSEKLSAIKADLLNAYGAGVDRTYGYVIDYHTLPTTTYDPDLVALLNNNVPVPDMGIGYSSASTLIGAHVHNYSDWENKNGLIVQVLVDSTVYGMVSVEEIVRFSTTDAIGAAMAADFQAMLQAPLTLYGPAFDGAPGLYNTSLIQGWSVSGSASGSIYNLDVNPNSHFGVSTGQMWVNSYSGGSYARVLLSSGLVRHLANTTIVTGSFERFIQSLKCINQMDCGNYIIWQPYSGSYITLAEPVDEFAIISRDSLATYTSSGIFGLFDSSTTKFRTTRAAEYVVDNNSATVKEVSKSTGRSDYHGKKSQKKYKPKTK